MNYEDLLLEKKDGIATITLNVPDKLNALTRKMQMSLRLAVDEIAKDDEVRVVIVTGAGRGFCSGADVAALQAHSETNQKESRYQRLRMYGEGLEDAFVRLDKPVIAAINGVAAGAGFSLALRCDIRIASEEARFGAVFILRAVVPDWGITFSLPRVVGTSKALELMFTGEVIDAAEAERLGIVSRVVPHDELMKVTQELAARIAQQPPIALELAKRLVYRSMIGDIAHHLDWETYAQQLCFGTEDFKEGARAFLEKRQPRFKGE
ncbi:enoyl-CoA hydratase/isomerase family protein [Chloroflexota bacterium]